MAHRILLLVLAATLALPAGAAAQAPTELRLTPQGPVVEDLGATVVASGRVAATADLVPPRLVVQARPATGLPCEAGPTPSAGGLVADVLVGFGPFRVQLPFRSADSGALQVCGWVTSPLGVLVASEVELTVRAPTHALVLQATPRVRAGGRADVAVTGVLGARRRVLVRVVRGTDPCGASFLATKASRSLGRTVYRRAGQLALPYVTPMLRKGTWTVCAYVQEALRDPAAEVVLARTVRAG